MSLPLQTLSLPDLWQQQAVRALKEGLDVVVHAPTGAGKTFIFELLYPGLRGQAIFTVPTRALANDKLAEWRKRGWEVGIATGDLSEALHSKVVVATLETQRARLLAGDGPRLLVLDEYQMIADPVRGAHYELAIALAPPHTQLLLLSGSVANPREVLAWLERMGRRAVLISHSERPVPLEEVAFDSLPDRSPDSLRLFWPRLLRNALAADLGPVLLFAPRRHAAEQLAAQIAGALPPCAPLTLSEAQLQIAGRPIAKLLKQRVAYHHSGLSFAQRAQLIEPLAKAGQLRVVVATMGLAAGINFSMRSVAVSGTTYQAGAFERRVTPAELLQMFGRAGRRGLDEKGYALVGQQPPRLGDALPLPLRRSARLDWNTLLALMHHAVLRGEDPFAAALQLNQKLFASQPIAIGVERSLHSGPAPCGLRVDAERARFHKRGTLEMWSSQNTWEPRPPHPCEAPLAELLLPSCALQKNTRPPAPCHSAPSAPAAPSTSDSSATSREADTTESYSGEQLPKWTPAESQPGWMQRFGSGPLCRLPGPRKRYGRELHLGSRSGDGSLLLAKRLQKIAGRPSLSAAEIPAFLAQKLPEATGGGQPEALLPRGNQLFVQLGFGQLPFKAWKDSAGRLLWEPPLRRVTPACCAECPQQPECRSVPIADSPAAAWRQLGLIAPDGTPTPRGILSSFFQHGEGLAIAAALEDPSYPVADILFDIADLRGGPRFADEDGHACGRLGMACQRAFGSADFEGYLTFGLPAHYCAGASEAVRGIVELRMPRQQFLSETLRPGDLERALLEWRSLLRHIIHAPPLAMDRWTALQNGARTLLAREGAPPNSRETAGQTLPKN